MPFLPIFNSIAIGEPMTSHEVSKSNYLQETYGIDLLEYEKIWLAQNRVCAICKQSQYKKAKRRPAVDHDHETGEVRGLLCHKCNTGLGLLGDNLRNLYRAIDYLKNHADFVFKVLQDDEAAKPDTRQYCISNNL